MEIPAVPSYWELMQGVVPDYSSQWLALCGYIPAICIILFIAGFMLNPGLYGRYSFRIVARVMASRGPMTNTMDFIAWQHRS